MNDMSRQDRALRRSRRQFPLQGGTAVLTGAASGIGAALAADLAGRGCNLALADVNATGLQAVAARARAAGVRVSEHVLDVADQAAVAALPEAVLAQHGEVTVLINHAGVALGGTFEQVPPADFEWLFGINFWGVVYMTRAFLPVLRRAETGHIINLSSIFGIVAPAGQVAYSASKFAVRGFSEALRHELEGSSVGVTVVHPGGVRTSVDASARRTGLSEAEANLQRDISKALLQLPPEAAAAEIVRGLLRREKRVLVGRDARQVALIQRMFPVDYWRPMSRIIKRKISNTMKGLARQQAESVE